MGILLDTNVIRSMTVSEPDEREKAYSRLAELVGEVGELYCSCLTVYEVIKGLKRIEEHDTAEEFENRLNEILTPIMLNKMDYVTNGAEKFSSMEEDGVDKEDIDDIDVLIAAVADCEDHEVKGDHTGL